MRLLSFVVAAGLAQAQDLLPDSLLEQARVTTHEGAEVTAGADGLRFTTRTAGLRRDSARIAWTSTRAVAAGDRLRLSFQVRKLEPQDRHNLRATLRIAAAEGTLLETVFPCSSGAWSRYAFDLVAPRAFDAGALEASFAHGQGPQVFEIAGLRWTRQDPLPAVAEGAGERLENVGAIGRYSVYFDNAVGGGSAQVVAAEGQSFPQAIRITTNGNSVNIFGAAMSWPLERRLARTDTMHLTFWARRISGAFPFIRAQAIVERNGGNFSKSLTTQLPVESDRWQRFQLPFRMDDNYEPGGASMRFQFGAGPQVFEVGGIELRHYGTRATPEQLPLESTYVGRNDTAITKRLNERIDEHRKAAIQVRAVDAEGQPIAGARVAVQQLAHAFRFGSAVAAAGLMGTAADDAEYRAKIESHFNTVVLENDLKWPFWESNTSFPQARTRAALRWLAERNIPVRGHNLIWPGWRNSPADLPRLDAAALRDRITGRFRSTLTDVDLNGRIYHWDVQNEPFDNFDVQGRIAGVEGVASSNGVLGPAEAVRWFQMARQFDPATKLYLNDYDIFESGNRDGAHGRYTLAFLKYLLDNGAPVDGFGFQGHFGTPAPLSVVEEWVDRFAAHPVDFAITEFDINTPDESAQADYTREFTRFVFSHPRFTDFLMWGFWERRHWLPRGAMYRADWSSKPNAIAWNDLWFREWWSELEGETGEDGAFAGRVFRGAYQVTVRAGERVKTVTVDWPEGGEVTVRLEDNP